MIIKDWAKVKPGTLLRISWVDILADPSWLSDDKAQSMQPMECKNIGWFLNAEDSCVRISSSIASDGDKNCTVIPQGLITEAQKITYKR